MQNQNTISCSKIFLLLSGLLGFFLALFSHPLHLYANQINTSPESQKINPQKNAQVALQNRVQRVSASIQKKNTVIVYLKKALEEKSDQKLFSARDLSILKIANQNFKKNISRLNRSQQNYKEFLETSEASKINEIKAQNFKKAIYKSQQDVYYAFWEVYNLMHKPS